MTPNNLPTPEPEQYDPNLDAQDEELASGGNSRWLYVAVAAVLVLVLGYVALPKGTGSANDSGISSVTPTFMLDDASVTGTAPTAADSIAAGLKAAPAPAAAEETATAPAVTTTKTVAAAKPAAPVPAGVPAAAAGLSPVVPATPTLAAAPEPVAPAPAAAPEPVAPAAAPANVTLSGKIEDENGRPLVGATVLLRGSSKGTSTDANGNYTLEVPAGNDNTLVYGYGGYDDEVVRSTNNKFMNVTLTPRAKSGGRKRR